MKTLKRILLLSTLIAFFTGCEMTKEEFHSDDPQNFKYGSQVIDGVKTVTLPFDVKFLGEFVAVYLPGDEYYDCDPLYFCRAIVDVVGTGTHLGKFTGTFDFCACGPDDPTIEGEDAQYAPNESYFIAANGDSLFFFSPGGSVINGRTEDHPEYVTSYWRDEFIITGGTGRFEGASGGGMTDDYNSSLDPNSHHHWTGTITLIKGKKSK